LNKNILILTTGLSGSSVVTGLIKQAKYWCGKETEYKNNSTGQYETFENSEFVALNNQLINLSGLIVDDKFWYLPEYRRVFYKLYDEIDLTPFKQFIRECQQHEPWVLKDPKLWITIGFWSRLFDKEQIQCIVLQRRVSNLWLSQVLKRIIYDYKYLMRSEHSSKDSLVVFLKNNNLASIEIIYDDLIDHLDSQLKKLNNYLGTHLTADDWAEVYKPSKIKSGFLLWSKAILIYLKNYSQRVY